MTPAQRDRLDELATDIGRLRRQLRNTLGLSEQIAGHLEALAGMVEETAHQLAAQHAPGDDDAVLAALDAVDERADQLRKRLGVQP